MEDLKDYKCPCCGAPLVFDADSQNLHCESCETDFTLDTMKEIDEADSHDKVEDSYNWESYEPRSFGEEESVNFSSYSCPSCGASITGDDTLGSTVCPYCGNATIIKGQFEGNLRPDYIIPFKVDKKSAMKYFEDACKKAPFLPDEFKNKKKIEEMSGLYVPFWMFDCDCNASIKYRAKRVTTWSDDDYSYTKTSFYRIIRSGKVGFSNIPVDAAEKIENNYMESIEPFDYKDAVNFDTVYLSGYMSDKYDVGVEESEKRANERVKQSTENAFRNTINGYTSVIAENSNVSFTNGKVRYSMLPVWMLNIKYKDNMYKYAINGQTGRVAGIYPIDNGKKWRFFALSAIISFAVCFVIAKLFGFI